MNESGCNQGANNSLKIICSTFNIQYIHTYIHMNTHNHTVNKIKNEFSATTLLYSNKLSINKYTPHNTSQELPVTKKLPLHHCKACLSGWEGGGKTRVCIDTREEVFTVRQVFAFIHSKSKHRQSWVSPHRLAGLWNGWPEVSKVSP